MKAEEVLAKFREGAGKDPGRRLEVFELWLEDQIQAATRPRMEEKPRVEEKSRKGRRPDNTEGMLERE